MAFVSKRLKAERAKVDSQKFYPVAEALALVKETARCQLIKVHPFTDGNGRTVRGFINKFLEDAGFPPVYIKLVERDEYHDAMGKAIGDGDYSEIKNFNRYKVCDSIIELDINERLKRESFVAPIVDGVRVKQKLDDLKRPKSAI